MRSVYVKIGFGVLAASATALLADAWFFEKYNFGVKRFSIGNSNSQKRLRILLLSDLHFKRYFWPFYHKLVRTINELNPDLILIAGDVIDQYGTPMPAKRFFSLINESIPVVAIPGNHDIKNKVSQQKLRRIIEQKNGRLLVNESVQLKIMDTPITITGLNDFIKAESNLAKAVEDVGKEEHHLLLVHSPLQQEPVLEEIKNINAQRRPDLQICFQYIFAGHTHGGQVRLGNFVPYLPKKSGGYVNGWYNKEKPYLYLSKGFGTSTIPFRFGARSEITLFDYGV